MEIPEIHYARSGDVRIAYQVAGEGPLDLVYVMGWVSHLEEFWDEPSCARFFRRLASFSRLIMFDKRGTGLSDRVPTDELPTLEQRMDDVRAVLEAVGSERASIFGVSEGGPMSALFAATYPERTSALVMYGSYAKRKPSPDYPWAPQPGERERWLEKLDREWGGPVDLDVMAPSRVGDEAFARWWAGYLRKGASPSAVTALGRMNTEVDVRHVLTTIRVPTLIVHRTGDMDAPVEGARFMAEQVPGARYVELPGDDHLPWVGDQDALLDEIEEFLTGHRLPAEPDRVLTTVLFTDIVGSTARAAELGDTRWRDLLERHHTLIRRQLAQFRGEEIDTAGDGFLARFDGPARAIRCACSITSEVRTLGLDVRAGVHTGECELLDGKVGGIAVHIGARVAHEAQPGEVLVSSTVRDLVAGSGLSFRERGTFALKGVPGEWRLYAVEG